MSTDPRQKIEHLIRLSAGTAGFQGRTVRLDNGRVALCTSTYNYSQDDETRHLVAERIALLWNLARSIPTGSRSSRCCQDRGPDMRFLLSIVWTAMCLAFFMRLGFALQLMDPVDLFLDKDRCAVVKSYGASSCKVRGRAEGNLDGTWTITLPEPPLTIQMPDGPMAYQQPHWRLQGGNLTGVGLFAGLVISSLAGSYLITRRRPDRQAGESPA